jgi:hypothetical protein
MPVRVPADVQQRFRDLADYHGRTFAEEVRLALGFFDTASTLAALQDPDAEEGKTPEEMEAMRERVRRDLRALGELAFGTDAPDPLLSEEIAKAS